MHIKASECPPFNPAVLENIGRAYKDLYEMVTEKYAKLLIERLSSMSPARPEREGD